VCIVGNRFFFYKTCIICAPIIQSNIDYFWGLHWLILTRVLEHASEFYSKLILWQNNLLGTSSLRLHCNITCSAVALSRVLRTALVLYGNMETSTPHSTETSQAITMKLCTFDHVRKTNTCAKCGWNPPARGYSTHTWNIHFWWLFFLPAFLPSCLPEFLPYLLPFFLAHLHRPNG